MTSFNFYELQACLTTGTLRVKDSVYEFQEDTV